MISERHGRVANYKTTNLEIISQHAPLASWKFPRITFEQRKRKRFGISRHCVSTFKKPKKTLLFATSCLVLRERPNWLCNSDEMFLIGRVQISKKIKHGQSCCTATTRRSVLLWHQRFHVFLNIRLHICPSPRSTCPF